MAAWHVMLRDLTRYARNPLRIVFMLAIPLVLAGIFALVFGGGGPALTIEVLVVDRDEGLLSQLLAGGLGNAESEERLDVQLLEEEQALAMMERGDASALLIVPEGFTEDVLAGRPTVLEIVKNPAERFLPQVVEEGVMVAAVVLSQASRVLRPELERLRELIDAEDAPSDLAVAQLATEINAAVRSLDRFVLPPAIELEVTTAGGESDGASSAAGGAGPADVLAFFLPGLSILGVLFFAQSATRDIVAEQERGLLKQLLTAPVSAGDYLAGKCLSVFVISTLAFAALIVIGLAAGVAWGPLGPVVLLLSAGAFAAAGLLLFLTSLARTERQSDSLTTIVIMVGSMVGGSFLPISQLPEVLLPLSKLTVNYWVAAGFESLRAGDASLGALARPLMELVLRGALGLALGAFFLRRRILRGIV